MFAINSQLILLVCICTIWISISTANFTAETTNLAFSYDNVHVAVNVMPERFVYLASNTGSRSYVMKYDVTAELGVGRLELPAGNTYAGAADPTNTYAYFTADSGNGALVTRVCLSTFTVCGSVTLPPQFTQPRTASVIGDYLLLGMHTSPASVARVKATATEFAFQDSLILPSGTFVISATADPDSSFYYVGTSDSPAKIYRIDLTGFTINDTMTLQSGEDEATTLQLVASMF